jgi:hypothetical protein
MNRDKFNNCKTKEALLTFKRVDFRKTHNSGCEMNSTHSTNTEKVATGFSW